MNTLYHGDGDTPQHIRWNHDEDAEVQMTLLMTKLVRIIIIDVPFNFNLINQ